MSIAADHRLCTGIFLKRKNCTLELVYNNSTKSCECNPTLVKTGIECDIQTLKIKRQSPFWVNATFTRFLIQVWAQLGGQRSILTRRLRCFLTWAEVLRTYMYQPHCNLARNEELFTQHVLKCKYERHAKWSELIWAVRIILLACPKNFEKFGKVVQRCYRHEEQP